MEVLIQIQSEALNDYSIRLKLAQDKVTSQSLTSAHHTETAISPSASANRGTPFRVLFRNLFTMSTAGQRKVLQLSTQVDDGTQKL